jgi:hypothetical protein
VKYLVAGVLALGWVQSAPSVAQRPVTFENVAAASGIAFTHTNGASPDKYLAETMGSGGVLFDYDNDGLIDLFLVDGGSIADATVNNRASHRLYRNVGKGAFKDVSESSGIRHREYGMGACAGDVDNDGRVDLYVTNYGQNELYRNGGNGTFTDITSDANVAVRTAHAVAVVPTDYDNRLDVDLMIVNYNDSPALFTNMRDGTFRYISAETGLNTKARFTCAAAGDARATSAAASHPILKNKRM